MINTQTHRHTDTQTHRHTDTRTDTHTHTQRERERERLVSIFKRVARFLREKKRSSHRRQRHLSTKEGGPTDTMTAENEGAAAPSNNGEQTTHNKTTNKVIKYITLGSETYNIHDIVSMKAPEGEKPYIAKILRFDAHDEKDKKKTSDKNNKKRQTDEEIENIADKVNVHVSWYYRPEESASGRKAFHGEYELFASDHTDWVKANTIESKIHVYTLADYQELESVNENAFFCRFSYKAATSEFKPDHVQVFCKCSMPYNPDLFMVECGECKEWYHPECINTSKEELVEKLKGDSEWFCDECVHKHKRAKTT